MPPQADADQPPLVQSHGGAGQAGGGQGQRRGAQPPGQGVRAYEAQHLPRGVQHHLRIHAAARWAS
eukprot:4262810-Prymnesium_polylepis.1